MKKILPIIIVLVIAGIGGYFLLARKSVPGTGPSSVSEVLEMGLEEAVKKGAPLKCEWKKDESNYGTSWIKGENVYSEVTSEGKTYYSIAKEKCIWFWGGPLPQGTKTCVEEVNYDTPPGDPSAYQGEASDAGVKYSCGPDIFTDAKFSPPTDVNFVETPKF